MHVAKFGLAVPPFVANNIDFPSLPIHIFAFISNLDCFSLHLRLFMPPPPNEPLLCPLDGVNGC